MSSSAARAALPPSKVKAKTVASRARIDPSQSRTGSHQGALARKHLGIPRVRLELRSLPSTGITRLQRYYEPLRRPRAPSLSLAGFRLVIADHAMGLPVLRT